MSAFFKRCERSVHFHHGNSLPKKACQHQKSENQINFNLEDSYLRMAFTVIKYAVKYSGTRVFEPKELHFR